MHQMAPGSTQFLSKEEVNEERDGSQLLEVIAYSGRISHTYLSFCRSYGRTKLGMIFLAEQLAQRKLADSPQPVLALSVHSGTVDTDFQKAWKESYGILGKVMEGLSQVLGKSAGEGAESSLWAATSPDINE